jgi:hypothetical protein
MATQATYVGIVPRTAIPSAVAIARGIRVTIATTTGLVAASAIGVRGDYVTLTSCAASEPVSVASLQGGGKVPMVASEDTTIGAAAYSAADGKTSVTSGGGAILLGKWTTATAADTLGEVELSNPA